MIGDELKKLLSARNLTVVELARQTEISPQTLYSIIKRNNQKVELDLLIRICHVLDVPIDTFYPAMPQDSHENKSSLLSTEEQLLVERYRALDHFGKDMVESVIQKELLRYQCQSRSSPVSVMTENREK